MKKKEPTKEQLELEELQYENCWKYETFNGWPRLVVWSLKMLTSYLNYFSPTVNINKLKKDPEIVEVELRSIVGVRTKSNVAPPHDGWESLESSLDEHGYDPSKFNYIELNKQRVIIDGKCRLSLLISKHRNPFHKIKVVIWDVDVFKSDRQVSRRRIIWNSILIVIITTLILLLT
jgi:hypothetical protein